MYYLYLINKKFTVTDKIQMEGIYVFCCESYEKVWDRVCSLNKELNLK